MRKAVDQYLLSVANEVIAEQKQKGLYASGRSAKSLKRKFAGNDNKGVGRLLGSDYFEQQFYGRGPTRNGGGGFLRKAIRAWLDNKPFASSFTKKEKEGLSYGITAKIHERGTRRGNDPRYPGINFKQIVNKYKPKLKKELGKELKAKFKSEVIRAYRDK